MFDICCHCNDLLLDLQQEYTEGFPLDQLPDLARECAYIRTFHSIDELFKFHHFNDEGM